LQLAVVKRHRRPPHVIFTRSTPYWHSRLASASLLPSRPVPRSAFGYTSWPPRPTLSHMSQPPSQPWDPNADNPGHSYPPQQPSPGYGAPPPPSAPGY